MHIFQKSDHISPRFEKNKIEQAPPPAPLPLDKAPPSNKRPGRYFQE